MKESRLTIDFAGEVSTVLPGETFTIGRQGTLALDDNPYLHRHFLEISHGNGLWWVSNVGSRLAAHLTDSTAVMRTLLAPLARQPLVFPVTLLTFSAGATMYELELRHAGAGFAPAPGTTAAGDTTIAPNPFTESQLLAVLALAEPRLRRAGTGAALVPTAVEAASRLGWTQARFNRKLDNVCEKLERAGVRGLRGTLGAPAANRRVELVDYAVSTLMVTAADLPLLEREARAMHGGSARGKDIQ